MKLNHGWVIISHRCMCIPLPMPESQCCFNSTWTKWPPFRRQHFQMHFVNEKFCILLTFFFSRGSNLKYRKTSNVRRTLVGNKIVDHSDVVGASPVGTAPTTSSFSTWHLALRDSAKTAARQYENILKVGIWCVLYYRLDGKPVLVQCNDWTLNLRQYWPRSMSP